ncbi:hypothetical protein VUR80DRAFT_2684 [Thermomyces stellatus]
MPTALSSPALADPESPSSNGVTASTKPKLYILSEFHPDAVRHAQSLFDCVLPTDTEALEWRTRATAILIKDYYITAQDLDAAPQLRAIGKQGVGLDKVDVQACEARGVRVFNTPGVNAGAVAEMTLALAMSVAREIPAMVRRQVGGEAIRKETVSGMLLSRKVLGIVGMGNIGQAVARMFRGGLGTPIIAFDPYFPADGGPWKDIPHRRVQDLKDLLEAADVVTLHVPLTPSTKNLISYPELSIMKRSAILLNTARGGIVNEEDLARALEEGLIWGAGFDCHVQEPPTRERYERLWSNQRFVGTPHIAAATDETQVATTNAATDAVFEYMSKKSKI